MKKLEKSEKISYGIAIYTREGVLHYTIKTEKDYNNFVSDFLSDAEVVDMTRYTVLAQKIDVIFLSHVSRIKVTELPIDEEE